MASDGTDLNQGWGKEKEEKEMAAFCYLTLRYPNLACTIARTEAIPSFRPKHELDQVGVQSRVNLHLLTTNFIVSLTSPRTFGLECFHDSERQLGAVAALSAWDQVGIRSNCLIHMPTHAQGRRKTSPSSAIPSQAP